MDRFLRIVVRPLALLGLVLVLAGGFAAAQGRGDGRPFTRIGNRGHAVLRLTPAVKRRLARADARGPIAVLAARNGKDFVRFSSSDHGDCYGVRRHGADTFAFTCWNDFPSPAHPLLDESVFGADDGEPLHAMVLQGFAADGVAAIEALDSSGAVLDRVPVAANVYSLDAVPRSAVRLIAVDSSGDAVAAIPR